MKKIDISEFLIFPDTGENLTEKIQQAIDKCAKEKCILNILKGTYNIGTLFLRNDSNLNFEKGAVLSGISDLSALPCNSINFC